MRKLIDLVRAGAFFHGRGAWLVGLGVCAAALTAQAQINRGALETAIRSAPAREVPASAATRAAVAPPADSARPRPDAAAAAPPPGAAAAEAARATSADAASRPLATVSSLRAGQLLFVPLERSAEAETRAVLEEKVKARGELEGGPVTIRSFGGIVRQLSADDQEVQLKPHVLVGQPLQYRRASADFAGSILVGVADLFGQDGPRPLTAPLTFQISGAATAAPDVFEIDRTSPPYKRVEVTSPIVARSARLRVASNFDRDGIAIDVPVQPTLIVDVDGDNLRAFGMQTARITVTSAGGDGPAQGSVTLSARGAFLPDAEAAKFDEAGTAHATLRTDGPGRIVVTASAPGYPPGTNEVTVIWPWVTLAAATIGGLIGGFLRMSPRIGKGLGTGKLLLGLLVSVLLGVFVFALEVVGVKVSPVHFDVTVGDVFAFAVAGLAGWLGTGVLPKPAV